MEDERSVPSHHFVLHATSNWVRKVSRSETGAQVPREGDPLRFFFCFFSLQWGNDAKISSANNKKPHPLVSLMLKLKQPPRVAEGGISLHLTRSVVQRLCVKVNHTGTAATAQETY